MKNTFCKTIFIFFGIVLFVQCNKENKISPATSQDQIAPGANDQTIPKPDHIVIVLEENQAFEQIIGSDSAPYINSLAADPFTVSFTKSYAISYGSQPNYLDLFSGSNQGVNSGKHPPNEPFTTANLAAQLIAAGYSYTTYSEDLPSVGYNGDSIQAYVRRHNPAANWMGTDSNQIPVTTNQPFTAFPADFTKLPTVSYVVPNLNNDMHNGTIRQADDWLKNHLNNYIQWAKTNNSLFILTFDEDDNNHHNHIPTIFYGPMLKGGQDTTQINHYNVLRTIEDMYELPYAGNAANVNTITDCWK